MPYFYELYQLRIASELFLPELFVSNVPENAPQISQAADAQIRRVTVIEKHVDAQQLGPFLWATAQEFWLDVPEVASFLIRHGNEVQVLPHAGSDAESIRVFLLGSALGVLMFQRQHLVLHGNAVQVGESCLVCVGPSGAGKSTLAAALMQRGYPLLADDVVPVNANCEALPGFPRIKLWQDSAEHLAITTESLARIRPGMAKFNLPTFEAMAVLPLPIRWIYILNNHNRDEFLFEPIRGMDRFPVLRNNTYRVRYLDGMQMKAQHLSLCAHLSNQVHLVRVTRPSKGFALDELADRILADVAEHV